MKAVAMSINSLSLNLANTVAAQAAKPTAATERRAHPTSAPAEATGCEQRRPGGQQNRLAQAMMSALRELGIGNQAARAPAANATSGSPAAVASTQGATAEGVTGDGTTTAASVADVAAQVASEPAATVQAAVVQFAHELLQALRQSGGSTSADGGSDRVRGEHGGHRHHHGHHDRRGHGYGDMSQRLEALAQTLGAQAPAATALGSQPGPAVSSSISTPLAVTAEQTDSPVQASATGAPAQSPSVAAEPATTTVPVDNSQTNPLLRAFSTLFNALKPQSTAAGSETDMVSKLRMFLHTLAQTLQPDAMYNVQTPQVGGLLNITA
jgi:hypothetical protein